MRTKIGPIHPEKVEPAGDDELSNVNVKTLVSFRYFGMIMGYRFLVFLKFLFLYIKKVH